jgi:CBS domain-containing protein
MNTVRNVLDTKGYEVHATTPAATALAAVDEMCRRHVGALLVLDGHTPVGVVSERDLMTRVLLKRRDPAVTTVRQIMTTGIVCVEPECTNEEAMKVMTHHRCRHLPVVEGGTVVGIVSIGDLVRWASHDQEVEIRMLHEYVEGRYPG